MHCLACIALKTLTFFRSDYRKHLLLESAHKQSNGKLQFYISKVVKSYAFSSTSSQGSAVIWPFTLVLPIVIGYSKIFSYVN